QSQTWEYDPVADTWNTSRAPIPVPMGGAAYSIIGQFAYLAGHWNNGFASTDHYQYDIVADSWTAVAPVPVAIYRPAAAGVGTQEFLVGVGNSSFSDSTTHQECVAASMRAPATSYTSTYIYDTTSNSWTTGPNTNVPHSFTGGTAVGNTLLIVGGFNGSMDTNIVETSVVPTGCGTPTPTPTCTPIVINGSIATGDPSHPDKLVHSNIPQTCAGIETCANFGDSNTLRYESYTFTNNSRVSHYVMNANKS